MRLSREKGKKMKTRKITRQQAKELFEAGKTIILQPDCHGKEAFARRVTRNPDANGNFIDMVRSYAAAIAPPLFYQEV